jgi:hypothetical protein
MNTATPVAARCEILTYCLKPYMLFVLFLVSVMTSCLFSNRVFRMYLVRVVLYPVQVWLIVYFHHFLFAIVLTVCPDVSLREIGSWTLLRQVSCLSRRWVASSEAQDWPPVSLSSMRSFFLCPPHLTGPVSYRCLRLAFLCVLVDSLSIPGKTSVMLI